MARTPSKPKDATGRTGLSARDLKQTDRSRGSAERLVFSDEEGGLVGNARSTKPPATITIAPPNMQELQMTIIGMAPLMICRFSQKAMEKMMATQSAGSTARKGAKREPRDFDADFQGARHISTEGWDGIHAAAFRNGMISACRLVNFKMTIAKLSVFIMPDGFDVVDGVPLVRIDGGEPVKRIMHTRNATGVIDLRARPAWDRWRCHLRISYDADQFTATDVVNLLSRVGAQVGVGEGRPDSRSSAGMGLGMFRLATAADEAEAAD